MKLHRSSRLCAVVLLLLCQAWAQNFEVAAIRPNLIGASAGMGFNVFDGGRLRVVNATLRSLVGRAYQIQTDQITGGPGWLDSDRFDIDAKTATPENITPELLKTLLQNLLAERFQLQIRRETREKTVYALVTGKNGPKLKDHAGGTGSTLNTHTESGKITLTATNVSMEQLAGYIGNKLGRVVLDRTELHGAYDFTLDWDPEQTGDSASPTMFTGLNEQLGLRLETQKGPVSMVVIERAERPSEN